MTFTSRRNLAGLTCAAAAGLALVADFALRLRLRRADLVSGGALLAVVFLLTLFNARKKLPFLPLWRAATWMQFHIYAGLFSGVLFGLHSGWRWPQGGFTSLLAALFLAVFGSGVAGLILTRWLPARLTEHGENVIFERIPALRAAVRREVEALVLESIPRLQSSTLADFYEQKLLPYFTQTRFLWFQVAGIHRPTQRLLADAHALDRYLNPEERSLLARILEHIQARENLDYQQARQGLLKAWLFVHIPLTFALILFACVHAFLAWRLS